MRDEGLDCRSPGRACPEGSECVASSLGTFGCVRITIASDAGASDSATSSEDAAVETGDAEVPQDAARPDPLSCAESCDAAIACLYEGEQCRRLTPGEERDVKACVADCDAGSIDAVARRG